MHRRIVIGVALLTITLASPARADLIAYPIAWPKAGGGTLVAVPAAAATIKVYHMVGAPHGTRYDTPFTLTPEQTVTLPAGAPLLLYGPQPPANPTTDQDDFWVLASDQPLVISIADDERLQFGSPDRIFLMPATSGNFRGKEFYGESNGGDTNERIRVVNLGTATSTADLFAWNGTSWQADGTQTIAPDAVGIFDPSMPGTAYKVKTTEDAFVIVGYFVDNATAPAVDLNSGRVVGTELFGWGQAWHLRAIADLSYVLETRVEGSTTWNVAASGSLLANQQAGATLGGTFYVRIHITGGPAWGIVGTPSLLTVTEWNGYFLPAQEATGCLVGAKFFTNSSARTITMLPNLGTTVNIYDEALGTLLDTHTSTGKWEFHNYFHNQRVRVEFTGGLGAVLLVGTLNIGDCTEATMPANCGILEGGYSMPGVAGFRCSEEIGGTLADCDVAATVNCDSLVPQPDAAPWPDAAPTPDGGGGVPDAGGPGLTEPGSGCCSPATRGQSASGPSASWFLCACCALLIGRRRRR